MQIFPKAESGSLFAQAKLIPAGYRLLYAFIAGLIRLPFFLYVCWCAIGLPALFLSFLALLFVPLLLAIKHGIWSPMLIYVIPLVWGMAGKPSPFAAFMAWIGTLKAFRLPPCVIENPGAYLLKGKDTRAILRILEPGDILLRGYNGYIDGFFIRRLSGTGDKVGHFTHAALYVGRIGEKDRTLAAADLRVQDAAGQWHPAPDEVKEEVRLGKLFETGEQMVIHSMGHGVHAEDILTFCRCDHLVILRLPELISADDGHGEFFQLRPGTPEFAQQRKLAETREEIPREEAVRLAIISALGKIGSAYDFECGSIEDHRFTCSEFVYYCYRGIHRYIGLLPRRHSLFGVPWLLPRETITPDDFYGISAPVDRSGQSRLVVVWKSEGIG